MKLFFYVYKFVFKRLFQIEKKLFLTTLELTIILGTLPSITSFILKKIIAYMETYNFQSNIYLLLIVLSALYALLLSIKEIAFISRFSLYNLIGIELTFDIQSLILEKIKKIPYKTFFSQSFQDLYANILKNSNSECFKIVVSLSALIISLTEVIFATIILSNLRIELIFILVICTVPSLFLRNKTQKDFIDINKSSIKIERKNIYIFNTLTDKNYLKEIRLFNLEDYFNKKRKINFEDILLKWKNFSKLQIKKILFAQIITYIGCFFSFCYIISLALNKVINVSDFVFYSGIIISFQSAFGSFSTQLSESYRGILFVNQLFDFFELEEENFKNILPISLNNKEFIIEFHNVSFKYYNCKNYALYKINLKFKLGEKISIVGKNGCGKSTLISLLLRHYIPTSGYISLNGVDIQDYNLLEYRKLFSAIYQDFQKFAVPISDFISFGNINNAKNIEKLKTATQKSKINNLVEKLPRQYDSQLTQLFDTNGVELSGGQWQRLAVSRVFFSQSPILIFDEPTSAMDAITEANVYNEINKIDGKLIIFISHRMYTLKYADKIVYMKNGKVFAVGRHEELLNACDEYKKFFIT